VENFIENTLPEFSQEQIEAAKAKYGSKCLKISEIFPNEDDEEPVRFLLKKPSKNLIYLLGSKEYENDVQKSSKAMISNCVLAGDAQLLENDASVYTELVSQIGGMAKAAKSSLKKV